MAITTYRINGVECTTTMPRGAAVEMIDALAVTTGSRVELVLVNGLDVDVIDGELEHATRARRVELERQAARSRVTMSDRWLDLHERLHKSRTSPKCPHCNGR